MAYALGVDLGTTYSAAAIARDGRVEIFQLGDRAATTPSVVLLRDAGTVLTGEAAERRALSEPTRTAREFKRRLGDPAPIILGGTPYGAEALLAHLLRSIVQRVTEQLGEAPTSIGLTHPASYGPYKLDLLRQAVRLADVGEIVLISEPAAAAIDYAAQERVPTGTVICVYDFGGGTFDATVLRKTDEGFEHLGEPEGMERLGGIDFDEAIFAHVDQALGGALERLDPSDPRSVTAVARLRDECRRAKEALSVDTDATIAVLLPNLQTDIRITREEFEAMIRPRIAETIAALRRAVRSAGLEMIDVDRILLVGGTSRIPLIAEMVRDATGRPVSVDAHPKHAVALGAARIAANRIAEPAAATLEVAGVVAAAEAAALDASGPAVGPKPPVVERESADGRSRRFVAAAGAGLLAVALLGVAGAFALLGGAASSPTPTTPPVAMTSPTPIRSSGASFVVSASPEPTASALVVMTPSPTPPRIATPSPTPTRTPRTPTPRPETPRPRPATPTPGPTPVDCTGIGDVAQSFTILSSDQQEATIPEGVAWCVVKVEFVPGTSPNEGTLEAFTFTLGTLAEVQIPFCCESVFVPESGNFKPPFLLYASDTVYWAPDVDTDYWFYLYYKVVEEP